MYLLTFVNVRSLKFELSFICQDEAYFKQQGVTRELMLNLWTYLLKKWRLCGIKNTIISRMMFMLSLTIKTWR